MFSQDFVFYHLLARMNAAFFTQCSAYNPLYFIFFLSEQFKILWQVPNDSLAMNQIFLSLLVIYLCKKLILRSLADKLKYGTSETNLLTSCTKINYSCRSYYRSCSICLHSCYRILGNRVHLGRVQYLVQQYRFRIVYQG